MILPDQGEVERHILFEVRYSESAAKVQVTNRPGHRVGKSKYKLYRVALRLGKNLGMQVLRTCKYMESKNIQVILGEIS